MTGIEDTLVDPPIPLNNSNEEVKELASQESKRSQSINTVRSSQVSESVKIAVEKYVESVFEKIEKDMKEGNQEFNEINKNLIDFERVH